MHCGWFATHLVGVLLVVVATRLLVNVGASAAIVVEGTAVNGASLHSYALVAKDLMAALEEIGQAIVLAPTKGGGICVTRLAKPHVVLRFSFPLDTRPCPGALATIVFGTTEFRVVSDRMLAPASITPLKLPRGTIVATPSRWSRSGFLRSGFARETVIVLRHGVNTSAFVPGVEKTADTSNTFTFLHVGSMAMTKGTGLLIAAFARLCAERNDVKLVLKGLDERYNSFSLLSEFPESTRLLNEGRIEYIGSALTREELARLYRRANAYVAPYLGEGFNLPVLEAMASGLPVIVTSGGSTDDFTKPTFARYVSSRRRQVIYDGAAAEILVPDQQSLYREMAFVSSPASSDFRRRAGVAARKEVTERHTWKVIAAEVARWVSSLEQHCSELGDVLRRVLEEPPVQANLSSAAERRKEVQQGLRHLVESTRERRGGMMRPSCDASRYLAPTANGYPTVPNIFSMYRDLDDDAHVVESAAALSELFAYEQGMDLEHPSSSIVGATRVAFISPSLCLTSAGKAAAGVIGRLAEREDFHVVLLPLVRQGPCSAAYLSDGIPDARDPIAAYLEAKVSHIVPISSVAEARQHVRELMVTVIVHLDPNLDPLAHALSMSRLAMVQCAFWTNPLTTGSPHVDYYLASEHHEVTRSALQGSEQVVRLRGLGAFLFRPSPASSSHGSFFRLISSKMKSYTAGARTYICPHALVKVHPHFDDAVRRILELDPLGLVVFLEGRDQSWAEATRARFKGESRVIFLPRLSGDEYADMLLSADVMLDTFPYSGFTTTVEALSLGLPVITRAGDGSDTVRGSQTLAVVRTLDHARKRGATLSSRLVASTTAEYAVLATRAANEPYYREKLRRDIRDVSPSLFADEGAVEGWASFLRRAVKGATNGT